MNKINGDDTNPHHYDIIVVGAGLVGAAFALRMARIFTDKHNTGKGEASEPGKIALLEARTITGPTNLLPDTFDSQVVAVTEASRQWLDTLNVWQSCEPRVCPYKRTNGHTVL